MKKAILVISAVLCLFISGCMNLFSSGSSGKLTVYLTDAVLPIEDVNRIDLTIDRILLMSSTDDASLVVTDQATTVNLLDLVGKETSFPTIETSGSFNQLRFEVSQATITIKDEEHELKISSSSLKYPFTEPLQVNSDTVLVLDFDLSRSIKVTGSGDNGNGQGNNPVEYHMTPVIHLRYGKLYDINGKVVSNDSNGIAHALVALTDSATVVATTFTHKQSNEWEEGEFKLSKIRPGEYTMKIFLDTAYTRWDDQKDLANYIMTETPAATEIVNLGYQDLDLGEIVVQQ